MQTSYIYELTVGLLILVALFLWVGMMIRFNAGKCGFWFRIFGYGLSVNDRKNYTPFSVRNGFRRELRLGRWGIQGLKP